ncbi:MAG: IPT/TIG domain-containing protein [Rhodanobacteraceae bacterium]|nr:IPT/TIG domain-containing protein [Rhodanobacteraceae bacterium]
MNEVTPGRPFVLRPTPYGRLFESVISAAMDTTRMGDVLAQWKPAAQNGLPFIHASARHAWLMLRPDTSAPVPTWVVHDPKGGAIAGARESGRGNVASEGGPYWVVAQDWLELAMRTKNPGYAYIAQVVEPKWPPLPEIPLQSLAVPFIADDGSRTQGHFCFKVRADQQQCMAWKPFDESTRTPYAWRNCSTERCSGPSSMRIAAWMDTLEITLPVWNSDSSAQVVGLRAALTYGGGVPAPVASLRVQNTQNIPAGRSEDWSARLSNVCALRQADRDVDALLDIELWHGGKRIDRLPVRAILAPRPTIVRITPAQPRGGDRLTIEGSGFGPLDPASAVDLDGSVVGVERWSERSIDVTLPASIPVSGTLKVAPLGSNCAASIALTVSQPQFDCARLQQENPNLCMFEGSDEYWACCGVEPWVPGAKQD